MGVSESSLKRWCDKGVIPSVATPGGHRKLPLSGVMEFLRQGKHALVHPEAIGLPAGTGRHQRSISQACAAFRAALIDGEEHACRRVLLDTFLDGQPISVVCDELLVPVFAEIGDLWQCGDIEVYRERRACRMCVRAMHELRTLLPPLAASAPVAMGGAPHGDNYELPTTMVELVLRQHGWQATSLGSNLPLSTLAAAIAENQPRLLWLSVSYLADEPSFLADFAQLHAAAAGKTAIVIGGRALTESVRQRMPVTAFCENMHQLEAFLGKVQAT